MLSRLVVLLERCCLALASVSLFGIMALTFFDVLGRKLFDRSISGSLELTELLMVIVIFGALPAVSRHDQHVKFDSLDTVLSGRARRVQSVIVALGASFIFATLAWLLWQMGHDFAVTGEFTPTFKIHKAPFIYLMGSLCAMTALMYVFNLIDERSTTGASGEDALL